MADTERRLETLWRETEGMDAQEKLVFAGYVLNGVLDRLGYDLMRLGERDAARLVLALDRETDGQLYAMAAALRDRAQGAATRRQAARQER